jgi:hypothetical protein
MVIVVVVEKPRYPHVFRYENLHLIGKGLLKNYKDRSKSFHQSAKKTKNAMEIAAQIMVSSCVGDVRECNMR